MHLPSANQIFYNDYIDHAWAYDDRNTYSILHDIIIRNSRILLNAVKNDNTLDAKIVSKELRIISKILFEIEKKSDRAISKAHSYRFLGW